MEFQFNPDLDPDQLGKAFRREGRLQIKDIWAPGVAEAIHDRLANGTEWNLVYNKGDNVIQVKAGELRRMLDRRKRGLMEKISKQALTDFAFCYLSYPVSDTYLEAPEEDNLLHRYLEFINTPETLDFFRRLSGIPEIIRGDAHATCYQGGHFLTVHDDAPNYEPRRIAYVFGFSEDWQPDWGGYLQFYDEDGDLVAGIRPKFNVLNIFQVPSYHSVTLVAPSVTASRYSITGWFLDK